jgi:hypothetical protein
VAAEQIPTSAEAHPVRLALAPAEPGIPGLRSALQDDPGLVLAADCEGLDPVVNLIEEDGLDIALLEIEDPGAALGALSRLATDGPLPRTLIALTGSGATDLVHALRRLGLRAEEIDPAMSPAEICELLARLVQPRAIR